MSLIEIKGLCKKFGEKTVFDGLDINIEKGEFVSIMGKSGRGKTTLLNMIGMIEKPDAGDICIMNVKNPKFDSAAARKLRATKVAYLFQNYGLIENDTVEDNLAVSAHFQKDSAKKKKEKYADALKKVGLENYEKRKVYTLSGGEQQRVALAKVIVKNPDLILADEPTGSLDADNRDYVLRILNELNKQGKTIVVVTHDSVVNDAASRKVVL